MYLCMKCGTMFDFPDVDFDFSSEYWGASVSHTITVCPECRSDDIEEMDKCEICGEWIPPGEEICENCHELVKDCADDVKGKARYVTLRYKLNYNEFMDHLIRRLDD